MVLFSFWILITSASANKYICASRQGPIGQQGIPYLEQVTVHGMQSAGGAMFGKGGMKYSGSLAPDIAVQVACEI